MDDEALKFLQRCGGLPAGRIVCSSDLTVHQIAEARVENRFYVDPEGFGYALLPWELTTEKDVERERAIARRKAGP